MAYAVGKQITHYRIVFRVTELIILLMRFSFTILLEKMQIGKGI